ncbi:ABC-type transport system, involved in lipoprotein release, permease component [Mariprofundus ferrinatatus]|uniref:ABC-type transport system, involved in lipoprotein release, permease component n=1 Tax=Mariprofundus ferrinatatus TaxID=1921087 RepID=A0A2K8L3E7_9PROT|nr:FtsX-like permease family protein [Mariprofundus ferrinatatus]ATX81860.1 ABC-type transport system, involved in lipoprotein release, permease component [Mariprofundus ferrinatatus]
MNLNQLAWRNIWRRKRRTLITAFSIGFGVMLAVTFTGSGDYTYTNMIDTGASMGMGHVTVEPVGYHLKPTLDKRLSGVDALRQRIAALDDVSDATVRITGQAMFASARKSVGGAFIAVDPAFETAENNLLVRSLVEGDLFTERDGRGIVIGSRLAQKLQVKIGKKVVYTTTDATGEIVSNIARVTGIFTTGEDTIDGILALLPIAAVQETLSYAPDEATVVAVIIKDQRHAEEVRDRIAALPEAGGVAVLTWKKSQPDLAAVIAFDKAGNYISQFLVGLLISVGILNTMLMSVLERTREFGVMMAVGMSPKVLFKLVMVESFWLSIVGLILGIIITAPWYYFLYHYGIDFTGAFGDDFSYGGVLVDPVFKARLFKESIIAILGTLFMLALLAGLYPAWRAGRVPPVDSLKTI